MAVNYLFPDIPNVDMFVTTADPVIEPPIITIQWKSLLVMSRTMAAPL
ncbi:hypothetical protein CCACVL1_10872 [Corchorus capsularis]|uniref:Uncharacterized protein n=1 Tax=Corchorus capsularis TaxID=210143 RepID=A0A1R3IP89_COCAP|nr:hypothetical protein CCACVL1_10872 [Corchorus capsularis]